MNERVTPTDAFSGLPLSIAPVEISMSARPEEEPTWHHHFHPRLSPELTETAGGKALRSARIQMVPAKYHNLTETRYHRFYDGPPIPEDRASQLGMCVLAAACYIPEDAIDLTSGSPYVRPMTDIENAMLRQQPIPTKPPLSDVKNLKKRSNGEHNLETAREELMKMRATQAAFSYENLRYGYNTMKAFLTEVVLDQDLSRVGAYTLEGFVQTGDVEKGLSLIEEGTIRAVEDMQYQGMRIRDLYTEAADRGRLHPRMPTEAATLVKYKLGTDGSRVELLPELRSKLLGLKEGVA